MLTRPYRAVTDSTSPRASKKSAKRFAIKSQPASAKWMQSAKCASSAGIESVSVTIGSPCSFAKATIAAL